MEDFYANHLNELRPGVKEELVDQIGVAKDLVELVSTRTQRVRATFNAIRRELHPMLTEVLFLLKIYLQLLKFVTSARVWNSRGQTEVSSASSPPETPFVPRCGKVAGTVRHAHAYCQESRPDAFNSDGTGQPLSARWLR